MKSLVQYLYRIKPDLFWEVATEDMIGSVPKKTSEPATNFLKSAGHEWEQWLLWMSWKNQVRAMGDTKNAEAYLGMQFFIRWLYHMASKGVVKETKFEPAKLKEEADPLEGVRAFMNGKTKK